MLAARPRPSIGLQHGRPGTRVAGRRRFLSRRLVIRPSFAAQGGSYSYDGDVPDMLGLRSRHGAPGQRRMLRQPRDLQQLLDILNAGGPGEDPEQFLRLVSAAPRVMDRRRGLRPVPPPPPPPPQIQDPVAATAPYRRMLQQQQQAAAEAEAARRLAQAEAQQQEEEKRRGALRAAMLQNARRHLPKYDASSLARLASALAAAGVHDPELCDDMVRQLVSPPTARAAPVPLQQQPQPQPLPEPRSVADLLDAFAAMRHRPSDAQIAELLRLHQTQQQQQHQQQLLQQQKVAELQRLRQQQQQQQQQLRLQPRGMSLPKQSQPAAEPQAEAGPSNGRGFGGSVSMSPDDAARLLYALSRLGYTPDERTLGELLEQLQPQRLKLQPLPPQPEAPAAATSGAASPAQAVRSQAPGSPTATGTQHKAVSQPSVSSVRAAPVESSDIARPAGGRTAAVGGGEGAVAGADPARGADSARTRSAIVAAATGEESEDELSYSLQRDAQAVASAVRALERMGRLGEAQQLRERFMRHVQEVQARVAQDRRERRRQDEAAVAAAVQAAERERRAAAEAALLERQRERQRERQVAEAAAAAAQVERERRAAEEAEIQTRRQQRQEEQAQALRLQLGRKLRTADTWQQIRVLLVTYQEALDIECIAAAAARLSELLAAARRTGRGLGLRDRGELGDLLEGLGELALRRLDEASALQAASLFTSVVHMRYLEERLMVGLLRRIRDTLEEAGSSELAAVLGGLAECGVRPTPPWMETFLRRCEDMLEAFTPEELETLPVCLAQLGAHPGRSWLGSYLDVLQEREGELSQSSISEAVHAVALLDRQFLVAWRQAAAVRQQQQQAAAQRAQAQAGVSTEASGTGERKAATERPPANALASVDETLAMPQTQQLWTKQATQPHASEAESQPQPTARGYVDADAVEAALPPMHPRQSSMEAERGQGSAQAQAHQQAEQASSALSPGAGETAAPAGGPTGRLTPLGAATQSIELDVDSAAVPYGEWTVPAPPASAAAQSPQHEAAEAANGAQPAGQAEPPAAAAAAPIVSSRQLPGSYSIDGYYSLDPFDEYEAFDEFDEFEEGEEAEGRLGRADLDGEVVEAMPETKVRAATAASAEPQQPEPVSSAKATTDVDNVAANGQQAGASNEHNNQLRSQQQAQTQQVQTSPGGAGRISINMGSGMSSASGRQQQQRSAGQQSQQPAAMRSVDVPEWEDQSREVRAPPPASDQRRGPEPPRPPQQTPKPQAQSSQPEMQKSQQQPRQHGQQKKPEDLAQARALRSLLLERYEAVAAFKEELEARRQRAAGAGGAGEAAPAISDKEAALAARYLGMREQLQRLQADYDNFIRRDSIEREQATARAKADVLKPVLGLADNFERAATQIKPQTDGERAVQDAYQAVYTELKAFLGREGVEEVGAEGEVFDPNQHEAVMREDRTDVPDGTVTGVFQKGYRLGNVLLRPALVKVAYS